MHSGYGYNDIFTVADITDLRYPICILVVHYIQLTHSLALVCYCYRNFSHIFVNSAVIPFA